MKKTIIASGAISLFCTLTLAAECDYTPDKDKFSYGFTGYGFPDKSYDVKDNTFSEYELSSESGKLKNASIIIQTASIDTSADSRNWDRSGDWPEGTIIVRNGNIKDHLFTNFKDGETIKATISEITTEEITLSVSMNGITHDVAMPYTIEDGVLSAKGTLDLIEDFKAEEAMSQFAKFCSNAWHAGKTWTDVDIYFSVPVEESTCQ